MTPPRLDASTPPSFDAYNWRLGRFDALTPKNLEASWLLRCALRAQCRSFWTAIDDTYGLCGVSDQCSWSLLHQSIPTEALTGKKSVFSVNCCIAAWTWTSDALAERHTRSNLAEWHIHGRNFREVSFVEVPLEVWFWLLPRSMGSWTFRLKRTNPQRLPKPYLSFYGSVESRAASRACRIFSKKSRSATA